jgi:hypothetical protein
LTRSTAAGADGVHAGLVRAWSGRRPRPVRPARRRRVAVALRLSRRADARTSPFFARLVHARRGRAPLPVHGARRDGVPRALRRPRLAHADARAEGARGAQARRRRAPHAAGAARLDGVAGALERAWIARPCARALETDSHARRGDAPLSRAVARLNAVAHAPRLPRRTVANARPAHARPVHAVGRRAPCSSRASLRRVAEAPGRTPCARDARALGAHGRYPRAAHEALPVARRVTALENVAGALGHAPAAHPRADVRDAGLLGAIRVGVAPWLTRVVRVAVAPSRAGVRRSKASHARIRARIANAAIRAHEVGAASRGAFATPCAAGPRG